MLRNLNEKKKKKKKREIGIAPDKALFQLKSSGPSCSKLTMSLVNDSLKFISGHTQIC